MWHRKGQSKKKDPKKIASALRSAIAGEELVKENVNGIDLSRLSTDQLYAILKIQDSDLPDDEKRKELAKVLNDGGPEPITGMRFSGGEAVTGPTKFTWFTDDNKDDDLFSEKRKPSWFHEDDEKKAVEIIPKPEPPKRSIVQRARNFFTGDSKPSNSESIETTEVSEKAKIVPLNGLQAKLIEMEKEFACNKEAHDNWEIMSRANGDLSGHIEKMLRF